MTTGASMQSAVVCSEELVQAFAHATGDHSAIHMDAGFARLSRYRRRVVHGLLPVFCLLGATGREIREVNCRFIAPAFLDDALDLSLGASDADGWQSLRISRSNTGEQLTSGKLRLGPPAVAHVSTGARALAGPVEQATHNMAALAQGQTESLAIQVDAHALGTLSSLAFQQGPASPLPASLLALLPLSTMVGMRLPGRHATFAELSARFDTPMNAGSVVLQASVAKLHPASQRIQLSLQWLQGGVEAGHGQAAVLVSAPAPADISSAELRAGHMSLGLSGQVALITGASRGIGAATARLLALHGAQVAVHYHQGQADAQAVVDDIVANGGRALAFGADLRDAGQVVTLFEKVTAWAGQVDILVNNAVGQFSPKSFEATTPQEMQAELDVSLLGLHACCQQAADGMRKRRRGKIVNVGTIATQLPTSGQLPYIAAKSAVEGYTRALAAELAADNVQVNLVVPAMTRTSLIAALPPSLVERIADEVPSGTLLEPVEVAQAVVLLCSRWTQAMSGQQMVLNQGMAPFL